MKAKNKIDYSKIPQREYAFGMLKGPKQSEDYVQLRVTRHLREVYPWLRFYSTLDGFNLGNQRSLVSSIQCHAYPGVADLFVFWPSQGYSMLVLELKKDGVKLTKRDGTWADAHIEKQAEWLEYFTEQMNAYACFAVGIDEAIKTIDQYLNPKSNGKSKRR